MRLDLLDGVVELVADGWAAVPLVDFGLLVEAQGARDLAAPVLDLEAENPPPGQQQDVNLGDAAAAGYVQVREHRATVFLGDWPQRLGDAGLGVAADSFKYLQACSARFLLGLGGSHGPLPSPTIIGRKLNNLQR